MNFWGTEVKSGNVVTVNPGDGVLLHVSQACLGGIKKDKGEYVRVYAEKDGKKFVLGILSPERFPHLNFDVVFEDLFKLSHDGKTESVFFAGYTAPNMLSDDEENGSGDPYVESIPIKALENGTSVTKVDKPATSKSTAPSKPEAVVAGKGKAKIVEPSKNAKKFKDSSESDDSDEDDSDEDDSDEFDSEDSDSVIPVTAVEKGKGKLGEPSKKTKPSKDSDESDDSDEDDSESEEAMEGEKEDDSSEDDTEEDDSSDEETPQKPETSKKRAAETSSKKTSGPDKKAKFATPVKTEGKKPVSVPHVATPYPSKQASKLPANNDKSKQQSPKSAGSVICSSCSRTFGSDQALQSHSKAKHGAK